MNNRLLLTAALATLLASPVTTMAQAWTPSNLGASTESLGATDMDMPAANVIWGIQFDGSVARDTVQEMFVSTDNGATWLTNSIITANSTGKTLTNISAIDGSTAYVGGFNAALVDAGGVLFKTTDGGNSFTEVTIPQMTYLNSVHFFDANTGILMGDPTSTGSATNWEIFRTTDAGATWTRVPQSATNGIPAANTGDYGFTNQFAAFGDNIWFGSNNGWLYHSTDRGQTWMKHATGFTGSSSVAALREIEFSDANNGLVVGTNGVLRRTTDGGMTFTIVTPTGPVYKGSLARVPGLTNAYVGVSADGGTGIGASVTLDGGQNWTLLDSAIAQYTDVIFFDNQHGWAGGFTQLGGVGGMFQYSGTPLATRSEIVRDAASAYPNPTTGLLRFAGVDASETVTVYDLDGRVLRRQTVGTSKSIDLSDLRAGLYQVVLTGARTARTTRVALTK